MAAPKQDAKVSAPSTDKKVKVRIARFKSYITGRGADRKHFLEGDEVAVTIEEAKRLHSLGVAVSAKEQVEKSEGPHISEAGSAVKIGLISSEIEGEAPVALPGMTSSIR